MVNFKHVFFMNTEEMKKVEEEYKKAQMQYFGYVSTAACGAGIEVKTMKNDATDYMPRWILSAIIAYLDNATKDGVVIHQDYTFFITMFDDKCFVEVKPGCMIYCK